MVKEKIIVSGCLFGLNCTYSGENRENAEVLKLKEKYHLVPLCPEQLGGLPTPRPPQFITTASGDDVLNGLAKVIDQSDQDVSEQFIRGANEVLKVAKSMGIKRAILKEKSPSCGVHLAYKNRFAEKQELVEGMGVTTAILRKNGLKVKSENELDDF
ncbi:MAG: DUF523 domain-containing protein [Candidatus Thorarchaeota archaeon]